MQIEKLKYTYIKVLFTLFIVYAFTLKKVGLFIVYIVYTFYKGLKISELSIFLQNKILVSVKNFFISKIGVIFALLIIK